MIPLPVCHLFERLSVIAPVSMRLTTTGRFAVTAMLDLAMQGEKGHVTLADISQRQGISQSYLEQLFAKLRRHEVVVSLRGRRGGYRLARNPELITVADIIIAVDEPLDATRCGGKGNCTGTEDHGGHCMTHHLWSTLTQKMLEFLASVSIKELVEQQRLRIHHHTQHQDEQFAKIPLQIEEGNASLAQTHSMKAHPPHTTACAFGVKQ